MSNIGICDQKTNSNYILEYIKNWKNGKQHNCSNFSSGLMDFVNALIVQKSNPNLLVREWCNSCVTIKKSSLGYITLTGALGVSAKERPIYYLKSDQNPATQLNKYNFDPQTGKWSDSTWVNVIVRQPETDIKIESGLNISVRTVPVGDYYYLFIINPTCGKLPMPVYQYIGDFSNVSTNPVNPNWPLINTDGTSAIKLTECPADCTDWKWI